MASTARILYTRLAVLAVLSFLPVNHRYEAARLVEWLMCVAETREPAVKDDSEFSELRRSNGNANFIGGRLARTLRGMGRTFLRCCDIERLR